MLKKGKYPDALWRCGGVELRADGVAPDAIATLVSDFDDEKIRHRFAGPVILTLRLVRDGGAWPNESAADRNAVWESLQPGTCDWVDLEIEEIDRIAPATLDALRSSGTKILLSHHAFGPEDSKVWGDTLSSMRALGPDGVKFAVTPSAEQVPELLEFARRVAGEFPESCVLGMGAAGMSTRLIGPLLGCPFTYGFIGEGAVAPGQLPAEAMQAFFARAATEFPGADASDAELPDWAGALLKKVTGA
jgi:3-dehydroquinate dehydratase type I